MNDLSKAVDLYRYNPRTWFNLGVAQHRHGSLDGAAESFGRCALYGVPVDPALAARAVLIAASLHRTAKRADASAEILRMYAEKIDNCAEIRLALGVHHDDHDDLVEALAIAPDLAVDALIGKARGLEEAATAVCQMVDGPVRRLRTIELLTAGVFERARDAGLDNLQSPPTPANLPPDGIDALLLSHAALAPAVDAITRLTSEIRDTYNMRQTAADSAAKNAQTAQAEASDLLRTTQKMETYATGLAAELIRGLDEAETEAARVKQAKMKWALQARRDGHDQHSALALAKKMAEQRTQEVDRESRAYFEQVWRWAGELASCVPQDDLRTARRLFEMGQGPADDRLEAWKRDVWAPLVEATRLRAQDARAQSEDLAGVAADAARLATEAADAALAANASGETALQTAAARDRLIPFDLANEWDDLGP